MATPGVVPKFVTAFLVSFERPSSQASYQNPSVIISSFFSSEYCDEHAVGTVADLSAQLLEPSVKIAKLLGSELFDLDFKIGFGRLWICMVCLVIGLVCTFRVSSSASSIAVSWSPPQRCGASCDGLTAFRLKFMTALVVAQRTVWAWFQDLAGSIRRVPCPCLPSHCRLLSFCFACGFGQDEFSPAF